MADPFPVYTELLGHSEPLLALSKRQRRALLYGTLGGAGLYFLWRAYKSDALQALIELRSQIQDGLDGFGQTFKLSSDMSKTVMSDLHHFLNSDEDKLPQSLRQLSKLAASKEASEVMSNFASAVTKSFVTTSGQGVVPAEEAHEAPGLLDRVLSALSTEKGSNLVSLAVKMACRSSVQAYCEFGGSSGTSGPNFWQQLLEYGSTPQGEKLYSSCVASFAREGTKVYMGSLEGVSGWDDLLSNLCKPERALALDRMTRSFVNELVVSYLRRARTGLRQDLKYSKTFPSKQERLDKLGQPLLPGLTAPASEIKERRVSANDLTSSDLHAMPAIPAAEWTKVLAQASKHPDVRNLVLSIAKTATSEGVRASMLTAKEILTGSSAMSQSYDLQQMTSRKLGALLLMVFMPIVVFMAGRRSGIA